MALTQEQKDKMKGIQMGITKDFGSKNLPPIEDAIASISKKPLVEKVGDFVGASNIGKMIGGLAGGGKITAESQNQVLETSNKQLTEIQNRIKQKKETGGDITRLVKARDLVIENIAASTLAGDEFIESLPTEKEVIGDATKLASFAAGGAAGTALKGKGIIAPIVEGAIDVGGFEVGEAIADGESTKDVIKAGVKGAVLGGVTGGTLGFAIPQVGKLVKASRDTVVKKAPVVSKFVRDKFAGKILKTLPEQQTQLMTNLNDMVVGDRKAVNNKLDAISTRSGKTRDELFIEMIDEGGVPEVKGNKVSYKPFMDSIDREFKAASEQINRRAKQHKELITLDDLKSEALLTARESRANASQLVAMNKKIEKTFESFVEKYGDNISFENLNEIRVDMNKKFKSNADRFEVDAFNSIGDAARKRISDVDPDITAVLEHQAKLSRVRDTADALKMEKISVNEYVEKLGGFAGVMLSSGLGIASLAGGPAGLLIAGLAANIGAKLMAKSLRKKAFSPKVFNLIKKSLDENPEVLQKLMKEADKSDAEALKLLQKESNIVDVDIVGGSDI